MNQDPTTETTVEFLGPLYGANGEFKDAFSGSIGLESPDDEMALEELKGLNFDYFYETTPPGAPEDCGDEREATKLLDAMYRLLGPQNMGGTSTNALVWGLTTGRQESHVRTIAALSGEYEQSGVEYRPGGHTAEGAHGLNCGCAAIDLAPDVVGVFIEKPRRKALMHLTAAFMGHDRFDETVFDRNIDRYGELHGRLGSYLQPGYQQASLDLMRQLSPDIEPVNQRVGKHLGLAIAVNRVPKTRLNQDILAATRSRHGRPLEAFGVDTWYANELGEKLFPHNSSQKIEFITGRIMYDCASLLAITNGSIGLLEHKEK